MCCMHKYFYKRSILVQLIKQSIQFQSHVSVFLQNEVLKAEMGMVFQLLLFLNYVFQEVSKQKEETPMALGSFL